MRTNIQNRVAEVAELVWYVNQKYDVFMDFAGHVDWLTVRFYTKWVDDGRNYDWDYTVHTKVSRYHPREEIDMEFRTLIEKLESYIYY